MNAPRSLKELVNCKFSYLTKISAPVRFESFGAAISGVRTTWPSKDTAAALISAKEVAYPALLFFGAATSARPGQMPCGLWREIGEDAVGPGAFECDEAFHHRLFAIEPAIVSGRHEHRVLT